MSFIDNEKIIKGIAFEKVIIEVLKKDNKESITINHSRKNMHEQSDTFEFDAFCSHGLNLTSFGHEPILDDQIGIIIKAGKQNYKILFDLIEKKHICANCIVLFLSGEKTKTLENIIENIKRKIKIFILDKNILMKNKTIYEVINSFDDYITKDNNILIEDNYSLLKNCNNKLSFALGAGCSINSNISDWNRLSEALGFELLYNIIDKNDSVFKNMIITNELNKKIFDCYEKNSALDAIYNCFNKSPSVTVLDYYMCVKKVLYMSYDSPGDANNKLMDSITQCIIRNNIQSVINYNFDSVLEQNYDNKYKSSAIEVSNSETYIKNCKVHHVHGYIPYDYDGKTIVNNFVFTDKEYYENMLNPFNYSNSIQENILKMYNVIFVGVSFTDANLKEHLRKRLSSTPSNTIFCFLKLPTFDGLGANKKLIENKYKFIQQSYFDTLGVKILWVNEFDEIPAKIDNI